MAMNLLSKRIESIVESATLAMAQKARELKAQGKEIISLSLGEPDFKTPKFIQTAAKQAIDEEKYFAYPPVPGYPELRKAIAEKLVLENQIECTAENIVVSAGAKHSIANIFFCLLNPGDEVIIFSPYWVSYYDMVKLADGVPVPVKGSFEHGYKVTPAQVKAALTSRTKAVIYSSPCNPSGAVFSRQELKSIASVLSARKDVMVIADEIYEYINYTGEHVSMGSFPEMKDNTVTVNGFSKSYAMTGWRVGYVAAPLWLSKACNKMQGQVTSGICTISQRAALAALQGDKGPTKEMAATYLKRRDIIIELLKSIPHINITLPDGAFYAFPDVSHYFGKSDGNVKINDADDLSMHLLNRAFVSTVSGVSFGEPNCIRLSYAASDHDIREAISRIKELLARLK